MASKNNGRSESVVSSDRGYGSISNPRSPSNVNPKYACYWLATCDGSHEQVDCDAWEYELTGKLGIYYSPTGYFRNFQVDHINGKSLTTNPTGSVLISLLIHRYENDRVFVLFITKLCRNKKNRTNVSEQKQRQLQLSLPSSKRFIKGETGESVARRAMLSITNRKEFIDDMPLFLKRFLFVNANVIYPVKLSHEKADLLNRNLTLDTDFQSVHWIPLEEVSRRIRSDLIRIRPATMDSEISQTNVESDPHRGIRLRVGDNQWELDSLAASLLALINGVVGFDEFLDIPTSYENKRRVK